MTLPGLDIVRGFFSKYLVVGLLLVIASGAAYHLYVVTSYKAADIKQEAKIAGLEADKGKLQAENSGLLSVNDSFKLAAEAQNQSLLDMLAVVTKTQRLTMSELIKTRAEAEKVKVAYNSILNKPPSSSDPCKAFDSRINEYIDQRRKEAPK